MDAEAAFPLPPLPPLLLPFPLSLLNRDPIVETIENCLLFQVGNQQARDPFVVFYAAAAASFLSCFLGGVAAPALRLAALPSSRIVNEDPSAPIHYSLGIGNISSLLRPFFLH